MMAGEVKPIPEGYEGVTPYLYLKGAAEAIDFYKRAFGAQELYRLPGPNDTIGHAEIKIRNSIVMLADWEEGSGEQLTTSGSFLFYVEDIDAAFQRAIEAGAIVRDPLEDKFYGDRMGALVDPFGLHWFLGTHIEDVPPAEMEKRAAAAAASMGART
jgi:PhnB protein